MLNKPEIQSLDLPSVSCQPQISHLPSLGLLPHLQQKGAGITALQGSFEDQKRQWVERAARLVVVCRNKTQRR